MIAQIYPIKRLPRRFHAFDYEIPSSIEVERGSLVYIPFRNITIRGLVKAISEKSKQSNLKPVESVLDKNWLNSDELAIYEDMAEKIVQSVSTVLDTAFLPPRKRGSYSIPQVQPGQAVRLRAEEISHLQNLVKKIQHGGTNFFEVTDLIQAVGSIDAYLRQNKNRQTLILVPHTHDADEVSQALASEHAVHLLDSRTTRTRRADTAAAWRAGGIKTMVATRVGALLPACELGAIFVLRPNSPEHRQYDRNPRYSATDLSLAWQKATGATLAFFDVVPTLETTEQFRTITRLPNDLLPKTRPLNLKTEAETTDFILLSNPVLKATREALQKGQKVLFSYNRKGVAPRLVCKDCNYLAECPKCHGVSTVWEQELKCHRCGHLMPIPLNCPNCNGTELTSRGIGNREIVRQLMKRFPTETIGVAEKGTQFDPETEIIVATQFYFENILDRLNPPQFGLVAELAADIGLSEPFYNAVEKTMVRLHELRGLAWRARANFMVQTWSPELISRIINEPKTTLDDEAQVRRHFSYPPFGSMWRITVRGRPTEAQQMIDQLSDHLTESFPNVKQNLTNNKKYALEIRSPKEVTERINQTLQNLPDSFIIETNPIESL